LTPLKEKPAITQIERVLHAAKVQTTGRRDGEAARCSDGRRSVAAIPGTGTNPEQFLPFGMPVELDAILEVYA
jgi:organic hydroperoxide reductase OsmC/OhrA